jgi:hypothetical protein
MLGAIAIVLLILWALETGFVLYRGRTHPHAARYGGGGIDTRYPG